MLKINHHLSLAQKRKNRVRSKLHGTAQRPRVTIFRSNQYTYLQAVNDDAQVTVASAHDRKDTSGAPKMKRAETAAQVLADALQKKGVKAALIDRGEYRYHGRIKTVAETLRSAGIQV